MLWFWLLLLTNASQYLFVCLTQSNCVSLGCPGISVWSRLIFLFQQSIGIKDMCHYAVSIILELASSKLILCGTGQNNTLCRNYCSLKLCDYKMKWFKIVLSQPCKDWDRISWDGWNLAMSASCRALKKDVYFGNVPPVYKREIKWKHLNAYCWGLEVPNWRNWTCALQ